MDYSYTGRKKVEVYAVYGKVESSDEYLLAVADTHRNGFHFSACKVCGSDELRELAGNGRLLFFRNCGDSLVSSVPSDMLVSFVLGEDGKPVLKKRGVPMLLSVESVVESTATVNLILADGTLFHGDIGAWELSRRIVYRGEDAVEGSILADAYYEDTSEVLGDRLERFMVRRFELVAKNEEYSKEASRSALVSGDCAKYNSDARDEFYEETGLFWVVTDFYPCSNHVCRLPSYVDGLHFNIDRCIESGVKVIDASGCRKLCLIDIFSASERRYQDKVTVILPRKFKTIKERLSLYGVRIDFFGANISVSDFSATDSEVKNIGRVKTNDIVISGTRFMQDELEVSLVGSGYRRDREILLEVPSLVLNISSKYDGCIIESDSIERLSVSCKSICLESFSESVAARNLKEVSLVAGEVSPLLGGRAEDRLHAMHFGSERLSSISIMADSIKGNKATLFCRDSVRVSIQTKDGSEGKISLSPRQFSDRFIKILSVLGGGCIRYHNGVFALAFDYDYSFDKMARVFRTEGDKIILDIPEEIKEFRGFSRDYEFDFETVLRFNGDIAITGQMDGLKPVRIENSEFITSLCNYAFADCEVAKFEFRIGDKLKRLPDNCFRSSGISRIYGVEKLESVSPTAVENCVLDSATERELKAKIKRKV
jgi:hypothetical protein